MFDVRPVDETGDLDWQKINSIGKKSEENFDDGLGQEQKIEAKAYILGVPVNSEDIPVVHESSFTSDFFPEENDIAKKDDLERQIEIQNQIAAEAARKKEELEKIAKLRKAEIEEKEALWRSEKERREQEKILALEIQRREIQKQKEILEKIQESNRQKEMAIAAEKARIEAEKQEKARLEALKIKEEMQRIAEHNRIQQLNYEENVAAEKKKRQIEQENLLKAESLLKKRKEAKSIWWFSDAQKKQRKGLRRRTSNNANLLTLKNIFGVGYDLDLKANLAAFLVVAIILSSVVGGVSYASKGISLKDRVLGVSQDGLNNLTGAVSDMANQNFEQSDIKFSKALENFNQGSQDVNEMGSILVSASRYIPFASKVSSGKNALEAGKHFSSAGQALNEIVKISSQLKDGSQQSISFLDVLEKSQENISSAHTELMAAQQNLNAISIDDLPEDKQDKFMLLREKMPDIIKGLNLFLDNNHILVDLLGGNGPRKYLFLFQNNTEMRATGGFIGSYGMLDIANGHVKKFFIDGIFNPDGQLKDRIVPPLPIQKISANWSMHDSNWFPDFPSSAKKAMYFYERTGGPTADGVITLTPTVLQKLLEITGPIEMPEYDVTLDSDNFIQLTQYEVEVDYDKEENKPKKILSDLAPLVMEKLLSSTDMEKISGTADALLEGLSEKHILLYSENGELQKIIAQQGWSGEVLASSKDYISVINTNINGYKTDAVIDENIIHNAEIKEDGSIVDTLTITRKHNGGSSQYEWLNKVNADYMRVYVPEGSKLLEVTGQTRESVSAPVDYDQLGFRRDEDIEREEKSIVVDEESGTRIYSESGKTVFGNWVYVSPGESVTITYKYVLPFSLFSVSVNGQQYIDSYSLIVQKQSGSVGSTFEQQIKYPQDYNIKWNFPTSQEISNTEARVNNGKLNSDRFIGIVFEKDAN